MHVINNEVLQLEFYSSIRVDGIQCPILGFVTGLS